MANHAEIGYIEATIANGASESGVIELPADGRTPVALEFDASVENTSMTFQAARTAGGTFKTLRQVDGAAAYTITVASSCIVPLDPRVFAGCPPFLKLVGGSAETGAQTVRLVVRHV